MPAPPVPLPTGPTASHIQHVSVLEHSPFRLIVSVSIDALRPDEVPSPAPDLGELGPLAKPILDAAIAQLADAARRATDPAATVTLHDILTAEGVSVGALLDMVNFPPRDVPNPYAATWSRANVEAWLLSVREQLEQRS